MLSRTTRRTRGNPVTLEEFRYVAGTRPVTLIRCGEGICEVQSNGREWVLDVRDTDLGYISLPSREALMKHGTRAERRDFVQVEDYIHMLQGLR